jgi:effector-binding domain-containing protein
VSDNPLLRIGPFSRACHPTLLEDDAQEVVAFIPIADAPLLSASARSAGVQVGELPGTDVAIIAHPGVYDTMDDSYLNLGAWVAVNAQPADLPVRELYLVGLEDTDDPHDLRTEICWPIRTA